MSSSTAGASDLVCRRDSDHVTDRAPTQERKPGSTMSAKYGEFMCRDMLNLEVPRSGVERRGATSLFTVSS